MPASVNDHPQKLWSSIAIIRKNVKALYYEKVV